MKNKKNVIMVVMLVAIALMSMGYALFATQLNINSIGNITSQWNVYFESISNGTKVGNASNASTPNVSGTSANMNVNLDLPGDSMTYSLVLKNGGTVGAIIEDIDAKAEGSTGIIYTISGLNIGDKLAAGASKTITIKIEYDPNISSQPVQTSKKLTVTIDAVQDIGQSITNGTPSINQPLLLSSKILSDNVAYADNVASPYVTNSTGIDFSKPSSDTNGKGLYYTFTKTEDNKTTYYFRGEVENNYVSFGRLDNDGNCTYSNKNVYVNEDVAIQDKTTCLQSNVCYVENGFSTTGTCTYSNQTIYVNEEVSVQDKTTCLQSNVCYVEKGFNNHNYFIVPDGEEECTYRYGGILLNDKATFAPTPNPEYKYFVVEDEEDCDVRYNGILLNDKATFEPKEILWRIVRINEDGSIRLILENSISHEYRDDYNAYGDNAEVGYMYGTPRSNNYNDTHANINDSNEKYSLDNWYVKHLSSYSNLFASDAGFCNDRTIAPGANLWDEYDTALGYGDNYTVYGSYNRVNLKQPQFKCPQTNDLFTLKNSTKGNKALNYPIGLLTGDEVIYAGGNFDYNNFYLKNGTEWITMSPKYWSGAEFVRVCVTKYGEMLDWCGNLRPVINLKSNVEFILEGTGEPGSATNPYVIKTN